MAQPPESWIAHVRCAGEDAPVALRVVAGRFAGRAARAPAGSNVLDAGGLWAAPMLIDAHVHLCFAAGLGARHAARPGEADSRTPSSASSAAGGVAGDAAGEGLRQLSRQLLRGGVCAALDLGAPEALIARLPLLAPLEVAFAGPLFCAPRGYPTQSWGQDGFGLELGSPEAAQAAVRRLHASGASVLKLSFDARFPVLAPVVAAAASAQAHLLGMRVAAHALDVAAVHAALAAGVDLLAHTPLEPLPDSLAREAGARGLLVTSTLAAFGGTAEALENLRALRAAGARVVYGTDLGNEGTAPGASAAELRLLLAAGLTAAEVLACATREAAALLGSGTLGTLDDGAPAHLLLLAGDPLRDPGELCRPAQVLVSGERLA